MKIIKKLMFFLLLLPFFVIWLWAISLPYFEFTNVRQVESQNRTEVQFYDWPHNRYLPDILVNIDAARNNGEMTYEQARLLREKAYLHRVKANPSSPTFWRQLSNFYFAYDEPEAAKIASLNAERAIGLYYPSLRLTARHYLLQQDKESAARVFRKLIQVQVPSDILTIYEALLNVYTPKEIVTDVLPFYNEERRQQQRVDLLNHISGSLLKANKNALYTKMVEAILDVENVALLEKLMYSKFFLNLNRQENTSLLVKMLKKIGYNAMYPQVNMFSFASDNIFCLENFDRNLPGVKFERSKEAFEVVSSNYRQVVRGNLICVLPIDANYSDIASIRSEWQGVVNEVNGESLNAKISFGIQGAGKWETIREQNNFNQPINWSMNMQSEHSEVFRVNVDFSLKSSIRSNKPVKLTVNSFKIDSKLQGL